MRPARKRPHPNEKRRRSSSTKRKRRESRKRPHPIEKQRAPPTKRIRRERYYERHPEWIVPRGSCGRRMVKVNFWIWRLNKSHKDGCPGYRLWRYQLDRDEYFALLNKPTCCIQLRVGDICVDDKVSLVAPGLIRCDFAYLLRLLRQDDNNRAVYFHHSDNTVAEYVEYHREFAGEKRIWNGGKDGYTVSCTHEPDPPAHRRVGVQPKIIVDWCGRKSATNNYRFFIGDGYFPGFFNARAHTRAHRRRDALRKQLDTLWGDYDETDWHRLLVKRARDTQFYLYGWSPNIKPLNAEHNVKKRSGGQRGRRRRHRRLLEQQCLVKHCAVDVLDLIVFFAI